MKRSAGQRSTEKDVELSGGKSFPPKEPKFKRLNTKVVSHLKYENSADMYINSPDALDTSERMEFEAEDFDVIKVVVKDVFAMKVWTIEVPTKTLHEDEQCYIGGKLQKLFQVPEPGTVAMTGDIYREVTEELQDEFFDESVEEQVVEWCLVTQIGGQFVCPWKKLIKYQKYVRKGELILMKVPTIKGLNTGPSTIKGASSMYDLMIFVIRLAWTWAFLTWSSIVVSLTCSICLEICLSIYAVIRKDHSWIIKFLYFGSAIFVLMNFMYLFFLYLQVIWECISSFWGRKFRLTRISMYFPRLMDALERRGDTIRITGFLVHLGISIVYGIMAEAAADDYSDSLEGSTILVGVGHGSVLVGFLFTTVYVIMATFTDCYSLWMGLRHKLYLNHNLSWDKVAYDPTSTRSCWYFWWRYRASRTILQASLYEQAWDILASSYVPYFILSPPLLLYVFVTVNLGAWATRMALFVGWFGFFFHSLMDWRLQNIDLVREHSGSQKLRKSKNARKRAEKLRDKQERNRIYKMQTSCILCAVVFGVSIIVYFGVLYSKRGDNTFEKRDEYYPACSISMYNQKVYQKVARITNQQRWWSRLDAVDAVVLADMAYIRWHEGQWDYLNDFFDKQFCDPRDHSHWASNCTQAPRDCISNLTIWNSECDEDQWQYRHAAINESNAPTWFYIHNPQAKFHVVAIRGTNNIDDVLSDMVLWVEISILQVINTFLPLLNLWTHSLTTTIVEYGSLWSSAMYPDAISEYYSPPYKLIKNKNLDEDEYVLFLGHSLGGGVAQICAAKLWENHKNTMSFSLSGPGTKYSTKKFGFTRKALQFTSINVIGERDPIPLVDDHEGLITTLRCRRELVSDCHLAGQSMCEIAASCWANSTHIQPGKKQFIGRECSNQLHGH